MSGKNSKDEPDFDLVARVKPPKGRAINYPVTTAKDSKLRIAVDAGIYLATHLLSKGATAKQIQETTRIVQTILRECDFVLVRILDRDLEAAGIAKRDDRGRTLDVHGAVEALPTLSLTTTRTDEPEIMRATGTTDSGSLDLTSQLAPTSGKPCLLMARSGTQTEQSVLEVPTDTKTKKPENVGVSATFSGFEESRSDRI